MISENSRIIDNKCPENVEFLRGKDEQEGELNHVSEERYIAVAHTKNLNSHYDNALATVSDMEYHKIKLDIHIHDLSSDLFVSS